MISELPWGVRSDRWFWCKSSAANTFIFPFFGNAHAFCGLTP